MVGSPKKLLILSDIAISKGLSLVSSGDVDAARGAVKLREDKRSPNIDTGR
jgi:hypothetical protein